MRRLESGSAKYPPGLNNAFLFGTFNALSFQIVLGSPMVLYAKTLGASAVSTRRVVVRCSRTENTSLNDARSSRSGNVAVVFPWGPIPEK